jgi:hypothetical protein
MSRNAHRSIINDIKKMPASKVYSIIEGACANYGDTVMAAVEETLKEDFGFGAVRLKRLVDKVQIKLKEDHGNER